jgi:hypothetical protein
MMRTAGHRALSRLATACAAPLLSSAVPQVEAARAVAALLPGISQARSALKRAALLSQGAEQPR